MLQSTWVQRFIETGGLQVLYPQVDRVLSMLGEAGTEQDYLSEQTTLHKRFGAQVLWLVKILVFAAICAGASQAEDFAPMATLFGEGQTQAVIALGAGSKDEEGFDALKSKPATAVNYSTSTELAVYGYRPSLQKRKAVQAEFETTSRFKDIARQVGEANLSAAILGRIGEAEIADRLLKILAVQVASSGEASHDDTVIIKSSLSLLSALMARNGALALTLLQWRSRPESQPSADGESIDFGGLMIRGIYSLKSQPVREEFRQFARRMSTVAEAGTDGSPPIICLIRVLMEHLPGQESTVDTSKPGEFFALLGDLIEGYKNTLSTQPELVENLPFNIADMLQESINRLKAHVSAEVDPDEQDDALTGLLRLVHGLLDCFGQVSSYDDLAALG